MTFRDTVQRLDSFIIPRLVSDQSTASRAQDKSVIVRVEATSGHIGWGEFARADATIDQAIIERQLAPVVLGADPFDTSVLWKRMHTQTGGQHLEVIGGVDMALWDIAGQIARVPVYKLLGGRIRDRVPIVATNPPTESPHRAIERGYKTVKVILGGTPAQDDALLDGVREAIGDAAEIVVCAPGVDDFALAKRIGQMAQLHGARWFENPLMSANMRDAARLAAFLDIPLASGNAAPGIHVFNTALAAAAFDIARVDVGISEAWRMITLADTYGIPFVTASKPGTAIGQAAMLHLATAGLNLMACELPVGEEPSATYITLMSSRFVDGYIILGDTPGLGVEVDQVALQQEQL